MLEEESGCSPVGDCTPCTRAQKDEWFCVQGFSQDLTCAGLHEVNSTKTVSCSSGQDGVGGFLGFELLMLVLCGVAFVMTNRRKAHLTFLQHHRISHYLST
ncbi:hypothetical protein T492DRAFT_1149239 [Pavlovales sp. CCMP2436]|nr:hypothetical protein T492DRAFT_1149239 [Pavlovales sp. CCMP2436]